MNSVNPALPRAMADSPSWRVEVLLRARGRPRGRWPAAGAAIALSLLVSTPTGSQPVPGAGADAAEDDEAMRLLRRDIETLRKGIARLSGAEQGFLGELKSLDADLLRRQEELAEAEERVRRVEEEEAWLEARSAELASRVAETGDQVARRVSALYRLGRPRHLRVLVTSDSPDRLLSAYRTAAAMASRDARLIERYRSERAAARREAGRLAGLRPLLVQQRERHAAIAEEARRARDRKREALRSLELDRRKQRAALLELEEAAKAARQMIAGIEPSGVPGVGFESLRGLLHWPTEGRVVVPFGRVTGGRTGSSQVHTGLDIDAAFGSTIRSIHDGQVVFGQWLRGYGLTVIVDHGGGWMSVYGHASVLLVEKGERVRRGQKIALVGDSGSIKGPYLYFEIRKDGKPVDPMQWLRRR